MTGRTEVADGWLLCPATGPDQASRRGAEHLAVAAATTVRGGGVRGAARGRVVRGATRGRAVRAARDSSAVVTPAVPAIPAISAAIAPAPTPTPARTASASLGRPRPLGRARDLSRSQTAVAYARASNRAGTSEESAAVRVTGTHNAERARSDIPASDVCTARAGRGRECAAANDGLGLGGGDGGGGGDEGLRLGSEGLVGGGEGVLRSALWERGVAAGGAPEGLLGGRDGRRTVDGETVLLLRDGRWSGSGRRAAEGGEGVGGLTGLVDVTGEWCDEGSGPSRYRAELELKERASPPTNLSRSAESETGGMHADSAIVAAGGPAVSGSCRFQIGCRPLKTSTDFSSECKLPFRHSRGRAVLMKLLGLDIQQTSALIAPLGPGTATRTCAAAGPTPLWSLQTPQCH
ncbi:uncharacterized protein MKK02DRAFT_30905 [Dioszegia hungarica]|uniref:Uncharacterized protein n=1 Tax=Dioszegia hungarica TaxID=4972 RepID=A0AA38H416_9TREE|nr:uncharacterized protein MKK02DRAFT_30905 [Dioszegia hungarica]KAI9631929.1 hypothetical protein MKK02DRAFT_30905 [Dioszegia hungarica]